MTNWVLTDSILIVLVLKSASVHEGVVWRGGGREGEWVGRLFHWAPVNSRCSQSPLQINSVQRRVFLVCSAFSLALCEGVYQPAKHSTLSKNKQTKHTHKKNAASAVSQKRKIMKLKQCQCLKWCFLKTDWKKPKLFVFFMVTNGAPFLYQGRCADECLPVCFPAKVFVSARPAEPGGGFSQGFWTELLHWLQLQTGFVGRCCWISVLLCPYKPNASRLTRLSEVEWDTHISDGSLDESQQISEGVQVFDKWVTTERSRIVAVQHVSSCRHRIIWSFPSVMAFPLWRSPAWGTTVLAWLQTSANRVTTTDFRLLFHFTPAEQHLQTLNTGIKNW